jgi:hypothetical protein
MATGKRDAARAALATVEHLHPAHIEPILSALDAAGLLDKPSATGGSMHAAKAKLSKIEAALADPDRAAYAQLGLGTLRRLGVKIEASGDIDVNELNSKMTAGGMRPQDRIAAKQALHRAGIIG